MSRERGYRPHGGGEGGQGEQAGPDGESRLRALMQRRLIQRKANGDEAKPAQIPQAAGAPLEEGVRGRMETELGSDLSNVRVHTGGKSEKAAQQLGARAFTVDSDVHFGRGEFAPGSREGDRLLAHELTHAVQRKADSPGGSGPIPVSQPHDAAEREADASADAVADRLHGGSSAAPQVSAGGARAIHRSPDENEEGDEPSQEGEPEGAAGPEDAAPGAEAPSKSADEVQAEELCQQAKSLFALDVDEPTLPGQLQGIEPQIQEAAQKFGVEHAGEASAGESEGAEAEAAMLPANSVIQEAATALTQKKSDLDKRLVEVWSQATQQIDGMGEDLAAWAPLPDILQQAPLKQFIDNYPTNTSIVAIKAKHKQKLAEYDQKKAEAEAAATAAPEGDSGGGEQEAKAEEQAAEAPSQAAPQEEPQEDAKQEEAPAPLVPQAAAEEPQAETEEPQAAAEEPQAAAEEPQAAAEEPQAAAEEPQAAAEEPQAAEEEPQAAAEEPQAAAEEPAVEGAGDEKEDEEADEKADQDPVVCAAVTGVSIEVAQKIIGNLEADGPPWKCEEGRIGQTAWFTGSGDPYVMRPEQVAQRPVTINADVTVPPDPMIISTPELHQIYDELSNTRFTQAEMEAQYRAQRSIPADKPLNSKQNKAIKSWRDGACRAEVWVEVGNRVRESPGQVGIVELANCRFSPGRDGTFVVCADNRAINIPGGVAAIREAMNNASGGAGGPGEAGGASGPTDPPTS